MDVFDSIHRSGREGRTNCHLGPFHGSSGMVHSRKPSPRPQLLTYSRQHDGVESLQILNSSNGVLTESVLIFLAKQTSHLNEVYA